MKLSLILAMDKNKLIGSNNKLPWNIPADLQHFKKITTAKTIVMGRETFNSIGKALPNRKNIVLTRNKSFSAQDVIVLHSIEELEEYYNNEIGEENELILIGGANLAEQLYDKIDVFYLTLINHSFSGDSYVKFINLEELKLINKESFDPTNETPYFYSFCEFNKK